MIKRAYISAIILSSVLSVFALDNPTTVDWPHVVPRSPDVAALEKFGDYPVGYQTGTVNVSVPLYHFQLSSTLDLDISLDYHTSGIKVTDMNGRVGTGWALNAGGCISREIRGLEDEDTNGFYNFIQTHPGYKFPNSIDTYTNAALFDSIYYKQTDPEPDLFYLSFLGRSYKFFCGNDGEFHTIPYSNVRIARCPLRVSSNISYWEVIDENGNHFIFAATERTKDMKTIQTAWKLTSILSPEGNTLATFTYDYAEYDHSRTCHLYRFENQEQFRYFSRDREPLDNYLGEHFYPQNLFFYGKDISSIHIPAVGDVTFTSSTTPGETADHLISKMEFSSLPDNRKMSYFLTYTGYQRKYLSRIERSGSDIPRELCRSFGYYPGLPDGRDSYSRDLWDYYNGQPNQSLIPMSFAVTHSWATPADRTPTEQAKAGSLQSITYPTGGRTELEYENNAVYRFEGSLINQAASGSVTASGTDTVYSEIFSVYPQQRMTGTIRFSVHSPYNFSRTYSLYNTRTDTVVCQYEDLSMANGTDRVLVGYTPENFPIFEYSFDFTIDTGNYRWCITSQNPNHNLDGHYKLSTISYHYYTNVAVDSWHEKRVGGIRIKKLSSYDADNKIVEEHRYSYLTPQGVSSGYDSGTDPFFDRTYNAYIYDYPNDLVHFYCGVDEVGEQSLLKLPGSAVLYSHVTEDITVGSEIRKTEYEYNVREYQHPYIIHATTFDFATCPMPFSQNDYMEGLLSRKTVYRQKDGIFVPARMEAYSYIVDELLNDGTGFRALSVINIFPYLGTEYPRDQRFDYGTYNLISAKVLPSKTVTTEYMDDGTPLVTVTETAYGNSQYINPTAVTRYLTADSADVETTAYQYCYDLTAAVADSLEARNMVAVPLQTTHSYRSSTTTTTTGYGQFTVNGRRIFEPSSLTVTRGSNAQTIAYYDYDRYGNPLHVSLNGSEHRGYLWSYCGRHPVAEIQPGTTTVSAIATAVQNVFGRSVYALSELAVPDTVKLKAGNLQAALPGALVTTMSHDPMGGLASLTGPSRLTTSYAYDAYGRLATVKEPALVSGSLTSAATAAYAYHYRGTDASGSNYVRSRLMRADDGSTYADSYSHADGLGRPAVSVAVAAGPDGQDIATATEYRGLGRTWRQWLPVPMACGTAMPDSTDVAASAAAFYGNGEKPFSQSEWEASALDRVRTAYGPGRAWHDGGHAVTTGWLANSTTPGLLRCRRYVMDGTTLTSTGYMPAATLHVTVTVGEDGDTACVFTDLMGNTVLQRTRCNGQSLDTYYVYDGYGDLLCVLPPEASARMDDSSSWTLADSDVLQDYAYLYQYDSRGRCTWKKLPGAGHVLYTYNAMNRLTASQDGNQRSQGLWQHQTYDLFGRPVATTLGTQPLRTCYYDGYAFLASEGSDSQTHLQYAAMSAYGTRYTNTRGLLTGERVYTLGDTEQEYTVRAHYYDERGRIVQTHATNHLGGYEGEYYKYTFTGQVLKRRHEHSAAGHTPVTEVYDNTYDHADRLLTTTCSINGSAPYTLVNNSYDEVGRLVGDQRNGLAALQTTNTYNVRSWPTSMGCPAFSEQLTYNEDPGDACYGGNIARAVWSTDGFATSGGYRYTYDALSRLTQADYVATPDSLAGRYSTRYAYDLNGNATSIVRKGMDKVSGLVPAPWNPHAMVTGTVPLWCTTDSMSLAYEGNRLVSVSDEGRHLLGADLFGFSDGTEEEIEYEYDENGNTVKDLNRKVSSIQYNSLNLPSKVTLTDGSYARYDYDAAGRKLKSYYHIGEDLVVGPGLDPIPFPGGLSGGDGLMSVGGEAQIAYLRDSIEYCGNVLYDNGNLDKVFVDGGYATLNATTGQPTFHFYVRDHLGSIRRIVRQDGFVERTNHYYPYGGLHGESTGTTSHRIRFSGKEYDPMLGLDSYDFGARWQMPDLTRFGQMDPLAEKYYSWSPYAYCMANPVRYVDPDGRSAWSKLGKAAFKVTKAVAKNGVKALGDAATYADAVSDIIEDVNTLTDNNSSGWEKVGAVASLASEVLPVSFSDVKEVGAVVKTAIGLTSTGAAKRSLRESAKLGQEAHRQIEKELEKVGAKTEVSIQLSPNKRVRKDAIKGDGTAVIIKPDTPSGHKSAKSRERLMQEHGYNTETIYYNPDDPKFQPGSSSYVGPKQRNYIWGN